MFAKYWLDYSYFHRIVLIICLLLSIFLISSCVATSLMPQQLSKTASAPVTELPMYKIELELSPASSAQTMPTSYLYPYIDKALGAP